MSARAFLAAGCLLAGAVLCGCAGARGAEKASSKISRTVKDKGLFAILVTSRGEIEVRLLEEEAPRTVENFVALAKGEKEWSVPGGTETTRRPLYQGTRFSRVIPGFLIQAGGALPDGTGGPGYTFRDETLLSRQFDAAGLVAMANDGPDSNGSQFFVTVAPAPFLNGKHTIFGEVVRGEGVAAAIAALPRLRFDPKTGRQIDRPVDAPLLSEVRIEARR